MANGSMPSWREWNEEMSQEQRDYSLYKILANLHSEVERQRELCAERLPVCNEFHKGIEDRVKVIEKVEKKRMAVLAAVGATGIGSGLSADRIWDFLTRMWK